MGVSEGSCRRGAVCNSFLGTAGLRLSLEPRPGETIVYWEGSASVSSEEEA